MKRRIIVEKFQNKIIRDKFDVCQMQVWRALNFEAFGKKARRIRAFAMNTLKAKYYEYD